MTGNTMANSTSATPPSWRRKFCCQCEQAPDRCECDIIAGSLEGLGAEDGGRHQEQRAVLEVGRLAP